eukprot:CAMPEP_0180783126 /NCGR_PEP_ID=MMETSP1038_2-20121128/48794_1 /TAXON_ID=632150 /ORGANISM="Azadinium spinosum, Strain 3D9" /LENGTH=299 /DNA_ID=CAMNT_0022819547 /DNA_START=735 /DNA_END=1636 /DNA_ORIENTATION=-
MTHGAMTMQTSFRCRTQQAVESPWVGNPAQTVEVKLYGITLPSGSSIDSISSKRSSSSHSGNSNKHDLCGSGPTEWRGCIFVGMQTVTVAPSESEGNSLENDSEIKSTGERSPPDDDSRVAHAVLSERVVKSPRKKSWALPEIPEEVCEREKETQSEPEPNHLAIRPEKVCGQDRKTKSEPDGSADHCSAFPGPTVAPDFPMAVHGVELGPWIAHLKELLRHIPLASAAMSFEVLQMAAMKLSISPVDLFWEPCADWTCNVCNARNDEEDEFCECCFCERGMAQDTVSHREGIVESMDD